MTRELKGWVRPRPNRIAFLIEDGEHSGLALDGIFADCYNRWGGRFSLIAPCVDGRIMPSFWPWLEAFDPDIVYSYVPLDRENILEIHERLNPAEYILHRLDREPRLDVFGFKPSYDFAQLSSLSVIFRLARHSRHGEGVPVKIIDSWHTEAPSRFLTDNFGTYHQSQGGGIYPPDATAAARLLTIVSPDKLADRQFGVPRDLDTIPDEIEAMRAFTERRATSLSVASILFASNLGIHAGRWSTSFNLVVGTSFADRLLFWNARLLIPGWLDTDLCCFRVELEQLRDQQFLALLGNLLKHRNHVNHGAGGQPVVTIRSASLNVDQLAEASELVRSTRPWSVVTTEAIGSVDAVVPDARSLEDARDDNRFAGEMLPRPGWTRFAWSPPTARPPAEVPDHLSDAPPRQRFTNGIWSNDFVLEHDGPGPRFAGVNRWTLPRRWRMAGAFTSSHVGEWRHEFPPRSRRSRDGNLTIYVSGDHPVEIIQVPTAREAMQYALALDGRWAALDAERVHPPSKVTWMHPSNEARYLTGVLGMTGGLRRAGQFLLHPFLRDHFAQLGGTPRLSTGDVTPTVNRLMKQVQRTPWFDLKNENERQVLANLIVKASRELKRPRTFVAYEDLKKGWKAYRQAYWAANPQQGVADTEVDWDKHEADNLVGCLIEMRRRQMMFQGHQWTCRRCNHRNWEDLGDLAPDLTCEVCKELAPAPVEIRWLFRPNEFLIESLQDHSVLSLVWLLSALCDRARHSLIFVEPTTFGFTDESVEPDAEADLLVILDGQALLCEVKSSWRDLRTSNITLFVALARRLRPDIALVAVMEEGQGPVREIAQARAALAADGIIFELLTPNLTAQRDSPYLHFEED